MDAPLAPPLALGDQVLGRYTLRGQVSEDCWSGDDGERNAVFIRVHRSGPGTQALLLGKVREQMAKLRKEVYERLIEAAVDDAGRGIVVTAFISGPSLAGIVERGRRGSGLDPRQLLRFCIEAASGVEMLHRRQPIDVTANRVRIRGDGGPVLTGIFEARLERYGRDRPPDLDAEKRADVQALATGLRGFVEALGPQTRGGLTERLVSVLRQTEESLDANIGELLSALTTLRRTSGAVVPTEAAEDEAPSKAEAPPPRMPAARVMTRGVPRPPPPPPRVARPVDAAPPPEDPRPSPPPSPPPKAAPASAPSERGGRGPSALPTIAMGAPRIVLGERERVVGGYIPDELLAERRGRVEAMRDRRRAHQALERPNAGEFDQMRDDLITIEVIGWLIPMLMTSPLRLVLILAALIGAAFFAGRALKDKVQPARAFGLFFLLNVALVFAIDPSVLMLLLGTGLSVLCAYRAGLTRQLIRGVGQVDEDAEWSSPSRLRRRGLQMSIDRIRLIFFGSAALCLAVLPTALYLSDISFRARGLLFARLFQAFVFGGFASFLALNRHRAKGGRLRRHIGWCWGIGAGLCLLTLLVSPPALIAALVLCVVAGVVFATLAERRAFGPDSIPAPGKSDREAALMPPDWDPFASQLEDRFGGMMQGETEALAIGAPIESFDLPEDLPEGSGKPAPPRRERPLQGG